MCIQTGVGDDQRRRLVGSWQTLCCRSHDCICFIGRWHLSIERGLYLLHLSGRGTKCRRERRGDGRLPGRRKLRGHVKISRAGCGGGTGRARSAVWEERLEWFRWAIIDRSTTLINGVCGRLLARFDKCDTRGRNPSSRLFKSACGWNDKHTCMCAVKKPNITRWWLWKHWWIAYHHTSMETCDWNSCGSVTMLPYLN